MKNFIGMALILLVVGCGQTTKPNEPEVAVNESDSTQAAQLPGLLQKALNAHGGLDTWKSYGAMQYTVSGTLGGEKKEIHAIDLRNRKVRIEGEGYSLGMDGEQVWVSPDLEAFGGISARFYHNLLFYFYSIPFVLADPGAIYEELGEQTVGGKTYQALKVSYEQGVGDSPKDHYIAHFNPDTYKLELLLYTVTYYSGEATTNYNSLLYPEWQKVGGLILPKKYIGHKYEGGTIGAERYRANFSEVSLKKEQPGPSLFKMPEVAEIDSLKIN